MKKWVLLRQWVKWRRRFARLWFSNSGDWTWLAEKPAPVLSLNRSLWRGAVPSQNFYILVFLSAVISTFGLLANSAATIIGAMIVAPLMGPIIAIAYSMVSGNRRLLKRASLTLALGILLTVVTSSSISWLVGLTTLGNEVMGRVRPTLLDLGVAIAAGSAGAFAKSRKGVADALPGVAIAVALVPPLSVVGIGIALGSKSVGFGSGLLFVTNLIGIVFSGAMVFLAQRYGTFKKAREGLALSVLILVLLGLPLGFSLQNLLVRESARRGIEVLIRRQTLTFADTDIRMLLVQPQGRRLRVELEVAAPLGKISQNQIQLVREFLEHRLDRPVDLRVRVIPVSEFEALGPR